MSTRVQKGGPLFRPVAKARPRPSTAGLSRQASISLESANAVGSLIQHDATPGPSESGTMQPPFIPSRSEDAVELAAPKRPPFADPPPSLHLSFTTSNDSGVKSISVEPRGVSIPPALKSHRAPVPVIVTATAPVSGNQLSSPTNLTSEASITARIESVQQSLPTILAPSQNVLQRSESGNLPNASLASDHTVEPRRPSRRQSAVLTAPVLESEKHIAGSSKNARKKTLLPKKTVKRKRGVSNINDDDANATDDSDASKTVKKTKSRSSTPRSRRSRAPSLPPYDANADPGEDIDPTVVTMATLCSDTGQGRVSSKAAEILSNHAAWKAKSREKRSRMKALMEAKKYGRDEDEEATGQNTLEPESPIPNVADPSDIASTSSTTQTPAIVDDTGNGFDYSENMQTSRFNVQVRIGPNGETIIDEESLVVDRVETDDTENYTHVIESDNTKFVNSGTYGKRYRGSRWSSEETELFYNALSQYGENYELIAYVLPGRDRKSCKNKFKIEDKRNHARINYCLSNSIPVDMNTLSRMTGKDFSGPVPEIRTPTPVLMVPEVIQDAPASQKETGNIVENTRKRKSRKRDASNDGVVIVGSAETFES
ncbi:hypothetical protein BDQ12DRAFT_633318 [Crucibulum laeve]|uniref:Uncharacterized protein n=1 Tax=Crucibulum laeve TaxID=68775 RepID=A0A5C3M732_9AGAR|nr:hypothetical protein BDQ12DRAFT_633318 [Crucibulum laeve]